MRKLMLAALASALCLISASASAQIAQMVAHTFTPTQADPGDTWQANRPSIATYAPSVASRHQLFLYLPGSGGAPAGYERILINAAQLGYHVLSIDYDSSYANGHYALPGGDMLALCGENAACYGPTRWEMFDGQDHSTFLTIPAWEGVSSRVVRALAYLNHAYPTEGWGEYFLPTTAAPGVINWSKVAIGGHSNGAGEAAFIATKVEVARVVMMSSPGDGTDNPDGTKTPAPWVAIGATPATRYFGFAHQQDILNPQINRILRIETDWQKLNMAGPITNVDNAAPPYGNAHMLITNYPPCPQCSPHNMVAANITPLQNGVAVYMPVWRYIMSAPAP